LAKTKILCASFDIHKSKLVANIQSTNFGKAYSYFVFSTNLGKISWEFFFLRGKTIQGHKCKTKHLNETHIRNSNDNWFFIIRRPKSCKNYFCCSSSFLKGFLTTKNLYIALLDTLGYLFLVVFQEFLLFNHFFFRQL